MDLGDKRTHEIYISAHEIAEDLARELNGDSGEGSFHGVFVAAGPQPTEALPLFAQTRCIRNRGRTLRGRHQSLAR
jgi:hypothetical protein